MADAKLALITGAAGGMGAATVARLSSDGFRIAALDIDEMGLVRAIEPVRTDAQTLVVDLTDEGAVRSAIARVEKEMGAVDALVNLVGWCETHRFIGESSDYWRRIVAVNFEAILYVTHAVLPRMIERRQGKIVNVSSDAARVGSGGEAVYAGAKGAVVAFTKSLAREVARHHINVNCTAPGPTDTPLEANQDPEVVQRVVRVIPFRRMATPDEQARVISFLCSTDSDFMTGQTLSVSGGLTMC